MATATDAGYRIDGVKDRVEAGAQSGLFLVVASCEGTVRQFLIPADAPGVTVVEQTSIDLVKRYATVTFDGFGSTRTPSSVPPNRRRG